MHRLLLGLITATTTALGQTTADLCVAPISVPPYSTERWSFTHIRPDAIGRGPADPFTDQTHSIHWIPLATLTAAQVDHINACLAQKETHPFRVWNSDQPTLRFIAKPRTYSTFSERYTFLLPDNSAKAISRQMLSQRDLLYLDQTAAQAGQLVTIDDTPQPADLAQQIVEPPLSSPAAGPVAAAPRPAPVVSTAAPPSPPWIVLLLLGSACLAGFILGVVKTRAASTPQVPPSSEQSRTPTAQRSGLPVISLVLAVLGTTGILNSVSLIAIPCAHIALRRIQKDPHTHRGRRLAIAALALGYLGLFAGFAVGAFRGYTTNYITFVLKERGLMGSP